MVTIGNLAWLSFWLGLVVSFFVIIIFKIIFYYRMIWLLRDKHLADLQAKYGIDPQKDAILNDDSIASYSPVNYVFGGPLFLWYLLTGSHPLWVLSFLSSDEDFGDQKLGDLKRMYRGFSWFRILYISIIIFLLSFAFFFFSIFK